MKLVTAGIKVIEANGFLAHTHFSSKTRQLFETEEGSFVYKMDEKLIYRLKDPNSYIFLLLKLLKLQETHENNT
jgi:hypothetical protein